MGKDNPDWGRRHERTGGAAAGDGGKAVGESGLHGGRSKRATHGPDPAAWLMLWLLVALWGSAFALINVSLRGFAPTTVVGLRLALGAGLIGAIVLVRGRGRLSWKLPWRHYLAIAVLGNCLPFFLITWGQERVPSGMAGILMAVTPLVVFGLSQVLLSGEGSGKMRLLGIVVGFAGVWLLLDTGQGSGPPGGPLLARQLAVLAGAMCYGVTIIIARRRPEQDPLVSSAAVLGISALIMALPAWLSFDPARAAAAGAGPALALAVLGALCTGYATVVYFQLVRRAGATFLSLINYLIPVWAVLTGALFLGERLDILAWLAMAMVLLGVALAGLGGGTRRGA